ncbi:MAG: SUF system NifU family Fe-S cluster assembly protein [Bacilli bacterium]|nr:SUF system NifU family Fe-S cluster assembly protein [Bacilli bacterium]
MPISMTNEMMRSIIMDHASHPENKHTPSKEGYEMIHMHSDNCIDDLNIYLYINNDVVEDACFEGVACTISLSSTDILCDLIKGKTKKEALYMIEQYNHMMHEEPFDDEVLDEAVVFINTSKQAARIRCATIGWTAADKILKGEK